jgi:hypothetical protein
MERASWPSISYEEKDGRPQESSGCKKKEGGIEPPK